MSLYDYFNSFSRYIEEERPCDKAIVLYWALLDMFNRRGWPEWAGVDNPQLILMCNTTNIQTARRTREFLCNAGFLEYRPSKKKGQLTQYRLLIPERYRKKGDKSAPQNVPQNGPEMEEGTFRGYEKGDKSAPQNAPQNGPILIKTKTKTQDFMSSSAFSKTKTTTPTTGEVSAENLSSASAALGLKEVMREFSDFIPGASVDTRRQMTEYCARLGAEVCHRAIMTARETPDVKNKLAYLFGILRNREADGICSGAEWDAHERERSRRNRDAPGYNAAGPYAPPPASNAAGPYAPRRAQGVDPLDAAAERLKARLEGKS